VLYLALEDRPSRLQNRLAALYRGAYWPENLHFVTEWPRIDEGGIPLLRQWIEQHRDVSLAIVDTLAKVKSKKASNKQLYDQDYQTVSAFKNLADMMEISIVLVHHVRKMEAEDPLDCLSGTTGLVGAADTGLILQRRAGAIVLYVRGRDIEEQELALKREQAGDWTLLGDAQSAIMGAERAAILKVFQTHKQVLSLKFLCDATGRKKPSILYHITKLVESGLVSRVEEGKYILERIEPIERTE
jgi:DNA-binding transcriptional ArsR family regulator